MKATHTFTEAHATLSPYQRWDFEQSLEMERFVESHDDVVQASRGWGMNDAFRLLRVIDGEEVHGEGFTMQEAYDSALTGRERRRAMLGNLASYAAKLDRGQRAYGRDL